jgi:hypothetical protein
LRILIISKVHKFEHILQEVEGLKPGVSSFGQAMQIANRYGADRTAGDLPCSPEKCWLEMHVSWFDPSAPPTTHLGDSLLGHLGIHFWAATSWIEIEGNVVTSYGAQIATEGSKSDHLWHEATWTLFQTIPPVDESQEKQFLRNFHLSRDKSPEFFVNWTDFNGIEDLNARISIRATKEQRHAAQDFNLKCLSRFGDCSNVCSLLPGAARDYNEKWSAAGVSLRCN